MGLVARAIEEAGIATVMASTLPEVTEELGVPRAVLFPGKLGAPIGRKHDPEAQHADVLRCLELAMELGPGESAPARREEHGA